MVDLAKEKIVVTSALPYANGEIHLGHVVSTYLPADIFTRFCRLKAREVYHVCGTDDYGVPILIGAEKEKKSPKEFVKVWHDRGLKDFKDLGISFDIFDQTSNQENHKLVLDFFNKLKEKGLIFEQEIEQWFCEFDKRFLPDRYVIGACPFCGSKNQYSDGCEVCGRVIPHGEIKDPKCSICGRRPVKKKSNHFFFKLSHFSKDLKTWLEKNKNLQNDVKNYVLNWTKEGLKDWDISRDINWGVSIPGKNQSFYGWFENHLGYISFLLKLLRSKNKNGKEFWNSSKIYHFIGKDIVYHHYLFLPAERMGEGSFKLPDFIPTRGHLLFNGQKLSKSRGYYIGLKEFLEKFPADYLRYYLTSITPYSQQDVNFDWKEFQERINNELVANIGNFVHRTLTLIWHKFKGKVPRPKDFSPEDKNFEKEIKKIPEDVGELYEKLEFEKALKKINEFCSVCNSYFQKKEPWKTESENTLYLSVIAVKTLALLLCPIIPISSEKTWSLLNLNGKIEKENWNNVSLLSIKTGHKINKPEILFKKIENISLVEKKK